MKSFLDFMKNNIVVIDGAMGTMLQKSGLKLGEIPESFNITNPEVIADIHSQYLKAGANVITSNTFGASPLKLKDSLFTCRQIVTSGVGLAKGVAGNKAYVALDIGPLGEMLKPMGTLSHEDAYEYFKKQVIYGAEAGADLIIIETMTDLTEAKLACLAAKENSDLPVVCTMSFEENGRTFTGCLPSAAALTLSPLADAVGVNCSIGPDKLAPIILEFLKYATVPVSISPNAGLPKDVDGKTVYDTDSITFAKHIEKLLDMGISLVGGCCGTTPEYIEKVKQIVTTKKKKATDRPQITALCTATKTVVANMPLIIGERINPTGKKLLKQALIEGDYNYIINQAVSQIDAGADILDVNTGLPEIDEEKVLKEVITEIMSVTDTPLQIDSSNPKAIETALRTYTGKAIVNSVNGEEKSMESILPLVKKYGAAVVVLTLDENGIPDKAEKRVEIAKRVVKRATALGIPKSDIIVDCLTLTVSAQQKEASETLKAITMVKDQLGVKTVLGVSNISFGLPRRDIINETFLAQALHSGLDFAIINPNQEGMTSRIYAHNVIANIDCNCNRFIERYSAETASVTTSTEMTLKDIVVGGLKDSAYSETMKLLVDYSGIDIVDNHLIPALDIVGEKYEKSEVFLPQLIRSAETVQEAFKCIKATMESNASLNKGTIVIATVKGDIHDIGKNIVKVILENYGYKIIDLGRDVDKETIAESLKANKATLLGLSALMTTTVKSMEETISYVRENCPEVRIMVGGAVLNKQYADKIGADYYAKDAKAASETAKNHFKE